MHGGGGDGVEGEFVVGVKVVEILMILVLYDDCFSVEVFSGRWNIHWYIWIGAVVDGSQPTRQPKWENGIRIDVATACQSR